MSTSTWAHPSLWRVVIFAIVVALAVNTLLWLIVEDDDAFAKIIAVASGVTALGLLVAWYRFPKLLDNLLVVGFMVWTANAIEFALVDGLPWENYWRQCGLYASEALLCLGAYVAHKTNPIVS